MSGATDRSNAAGMNGVPGISETPGRNGAPGDVSSITGTVDDYVGSEDNADIAGITLEEIFLKMTEGTPS
jgi:hypothetical protein